MSARVADTTTLGPWRYGVCIVVVRWAVGSSALTGCRTSRAILRTSGSLRAVTTSAFARTVATTSQPADANSSTHAGQDPGRHR